MSHAQLVHFHSPALGPVPTVTLERKVLAVLGLAIAALLDTPLHKGRRVVSSALLVVTLKLKLELAQHAQQESSAGLPQVLARRVWQEHLVSSLP